MPPADVVPERILVTRFGALGDLLMTTPTLRALRRRFPGARIDYIVGKGLGEALSDLPCLRRVLEFDKKQDMKSARFLSFIAALRRERYDLFLNLQPSVKTVLLRLGSGAPRALTYHRARHPLPETGRSMHTVDNFLRTITPLGIETTQDRRLEIFVPETACQRIRELLCAEGIASEDRLVVVNPGVSGIARRWPVERFAQTIHRLSTESPDLKFAISGGPGDTELADQIAARAQTPGKIVLMAGRCSIKETAALLRRANVVLTGDTGPMHLTAAVGTPLVALFGPTDPYRTGPMEPNPDQPRHLLIQSQSGQMDAISSQQAIVAVQQQLAKQHSDENEVLKNTCGS